MVRKHPNVLRLEKIMEQERRDWALVMGRIKEEDWIGFLRQYTTYLKDRTNYSPSRLAMVRAFEALAQEVTAERTWEESPETD